MKKTRIAIIIVAVLLLILLIPIPSGTADDGGSREFTALTYKIIKWNHIVDADETYTGTDFYLLPDNFKNMSELWKLYGSLVMKDKDTLVIVSESYVKNNIITDIEVISRSPRNN